MSIGWQELVTLFVVGLLVLGPERLPRVASQVGRWVGRARRTANQLRYQLEREIALADIEKGSGDKARKAKPAPPPADEAKAASEQAGDVPADEAPADETPSADGDGDAAPGPASAPNDEKPV